MSDLFTPIKEKKLFWDKKTLTHYKNKLRCIEQRLSIDIFPTWQSITSDQYIIIETHFKDGLNFLLTWQKWLQFMPKTCQLHFYSVNNEPLSKQDLVKIYTLWLTLKPQSTQLITAYPLLTPGFHPLIFENGRIKLTLMQGSLIPCLKQLLYCGDEVLEKKLNKQGADLIYLNRSENHLNELISLLSKPKSTIINQTNDDFTELTRFGFKYTSSNQLMVRTQNPSIPSSSIYRQTPWHVHQNDASANENVLVIGAGLAGAFIANTLAQRGKKVIVIERHSTIAKEASGNSQAILYPKLSAFSSPFTQYMLSAYLYAHAYYANILTIKNIGELKGIIQLAHHSKEVLAQLNLKQWLTIYPELGQLITAEEVSRLAGIKTNHQGMYLPLSGWMDMPLLCKHLIEHPNITLVNENCVTELNREKNTWHINNYHSKNVILANGYEANQFKQTRWLPLKKIPGQMTYIGSTAITKQLLIPLCSEGHLLPERDGLHSTGATYHQGNDHQITKDNHLNLQKLNGLLNCSLSEDSIKGEWHGIRAATPDYLPIVGPAPEADLFLKQYNSLNSDSRRWLPATGIYYPGLYFFTGFGSRGLTTIPLAAELLASLMDYEPLGMPQNLVRALSPSRFLIKRIVRKNRSNTC